MTIRELKEWAVFKPFKRIEEFAGQKTNVYVAYYKSEEGPSPTFIIINTDGGVLKYYFGGGKPKFLKVLRMNDVSNTKLLFYEECTEQGGCKTTVLSMTPKGITELVGDWCNNPTIKDLDSDGVKEWVCSQSTAQGWPNIPIVYQWDGTGFIDVSWKFPTLLREQYRHIAERTPKGYDESGLIEAERIIRHELVNAPELWDKYFQPIRDKFNRRSTDIVPCPTYDWGSAGAPNRAEVNNLECDRKILDWIIKNRPQMKLEDLKTWQLFESFELVKVEGDETQVVEAVRGSGEKIYVSGYGIIGGGEEHQFIIVSRINGRIRYGVFSGTPYWLGTLPTKGSMSNKILYADGQGSGAGNGGSFLNAIDVVNDRFIQGKVCDCATEAIGMWLEDLNSDGARELICNVSTEYKGPTIPEIFKWNGVEFIESSWEFPNELQKAYVYLMENHEDVNDATRQEYIKKADAILKGFKGYSEKSWNKYIQPIKEGKTLGKK